VPGAINTTDMSNLLDQIPAWGRHDGLGDGLALANYLLTRQAGTDRRNQVIVLFTAGEQQAADSVDVLASRTRRISRCTSSAWISKRRSGTRRQVQKLFQTVRR